jgi:hypothetical protein
MMKKTLLHAVLIGIAVISAPSFADPIELEQLARWNLTPHIDFVKNIASDRKILEQHMPQNVWFGTLDANSGAVYSTQHSPKDFSIPFVYYGKNVEGADVWVDDKTLDDEYPVFYKVNIAQLDTNLIVRWQIAEYAIGEKGSLGKFIGTNGIIKQMEFIPTQLGNWELYSVYTVKE